ncbi:MAG: DUF29 domain-containing protein [Acidobacteriia bacterium]|nr:DUF29 domain-containing protein [Terriglobia bacterium]
MKAMGTTTKTLYDTDFVEWTAHMAELLREGRFDEVDLEHVVEEIEDLGNSERSAVWSQLTRMLMHMTKVRIQPERAGASWRSSIVDARREITIKIRHSPSLRRHLEDNLQEIYRGAVRDALAETGQEKRGKELGIPAQCPWSLSELLDGDVSDLETR